MNAAGVPDLPQRERALDPAASFIVQAPAGSGKTELLIQRFLVLLGRVECPEEIAAITFTKKAAAEMRKRVFEALAAARSSPRPAAAHEARTWDLAAGALARDRERGWKLQENAARLRIQTFDALCASLTRQMPVLSRFGAQPESLEDARALYVEAARNTIGALDEADPAADDVEQLLLHLDNDAANAVELLASMLEQRDHWIRAIGKAGGRAKLERALAQARDDALARAAALFPAGCGMKPPAKDDPDGWVALAETLLTRKNEWRKTHPTAKALSCDEGLRLALCAVRAAPPPCYSDSQWQALGAITRLLPRAMSELKLVFAARGQADFVEIAQGALRALGEPDAPTDLLLALDYRIRHLLVDEFQDTSFSQLDLLRKLTAGWEPGDGRTLFVVGDPMQSIYRFRQAEVALFLEAQHHGIGGVALESLTLAANLRSHAGLVEWFNRAFVQVMPAEEDVDVGAVPYSPSSAAHPRRPGGVRFHAFIADDSRAEADRVVEIAREALREEGEAGAAPSVAILARNRRHLSEILPRLKAAGLSYRAIEIEPLGHRPVVQDLLALTRALSHLADRTAWLSVLRAPWCGLTLADLHCLAGNEQVRVEGGAISPGAVTVWEAMNDPATVARLSADGQQRLARAAAVFEDRLRHRRRRSLRESVEGAWLALAGPACVESETDLEDAEIYLGHLEESEEGGIIADLPSFELAVAALYALPDLEAGEGLQVMTIHKAKGLEFDTVILPGLERGTERDDRRLFLWTETAKDPGLLLAPMNPTGTKLDSIYEYIRGLERDKADHECGRLLYVAATRARHGLHLLGNARLDNKGVVKRPARGSLLEKLWPVVESHFEGLAPVPAQVDVALARESADALVRLRGEVRVEVEGPAWAPAGEAPDRDPIEFSWVGETARHVGSVVHRWLQRIAEEEMRGWTRARIEESQVGIRNALAHRGVAAGELDAATVRVTTALAACIEDSRGRWLLGAQSGASNEHRLTAIVDGRARIFVIDRMFTDAEGRRRIVDYKTSRHEGGDVESFLANEQTRYRAQLERYAQAALPHETVTLGLYFPLLGGWREWTVPSPAPAPAGRAAGGKLSLSFGPSYSRPE